MFPNNGQLIRRKRRIVTTIVEVLVLGQCDTAPRFCQQLFAKARKSIVGDLGFVRPGFLGHDLHRSAFPFDRFYGMEA